MEKRFEDLPNWRFQVDEVSAGVYNIKGRDEKFSSNLDLAGNDLEKLFQKARETAFDMNRQVRRKVN